MRKLFITSLAISGAFTAIAICALYQWYKTRNYYLNNSKKDEELLVQQHLMNEYGDISLFPLLKDLVAKECSEYYTALSSYCKQLCNKYKVPKKKLLLVRSKTGAFAFSLANEFKEIICTESSYQMIVTSQQLAEYKKCICTFPSHGVLCSSTHVLTVNSKTKLEGISFIEEGSLSLLKGDVKFNCVLVPNCLTEMENPVEFLRSLLSHVEVDGLLIIADTYNWTDHILKYSSETLCSSQFLTEILGNDWNILESKTIPYCFVLNMRKMEVGSMDITVWRKDVLDNY